MVAKLLGIWLGDKEQRQSASHKKKRSALYRQLVFMLAVSAIIAGSILIFRLFNHAENPVYVYENYIQIKGAYGISADFSEISDVILIEKSMDEIGNPTRINGALTRDILKGRFRCELQGDILLFVRRQSEPTIHIIRENERDIFLSFADPEKTNKLYFELQRAILNHAGIGYITV